MLAYFLSRCKEHRDHLGAVYNLWRLFGRPRLINIQWPLSTHKPRVINTLMALNCSEALFLLASQLWITFWRRGWDSNPRRA